MTIYTSSPQKAIGITYHHHHHQHHQHEHTFEIDRGTAMDARGSNRTFEEYDPAFEWSRAAEADAVKIVVPGFKREEIRVLVDNHGHLRTRGERPLAGNKWSRFQKDFQLPADCLVDGIRAKFENEALTITLPKKNPSPQVAPLPMAAPAPPVAEPRRPVIAPPQRPPPALPEPTKPSPPPRAPVLHPTPSQKPVPERRPSLPRKPLAPEPPVPAPAPASEETKKTLPSPQAMAEEEERRMEREARGKMEEDRKMLEEKEAKEEEAILGEMDMAQRRRPISTSRVLLVNVAVAAVVLVGITVYVWHTLSGGGGDGELGSGSYGDEM